MAKDIVPLLPDCFDFSQLPPNIEIKSNFGGKITSQDEKISITYRTAPNKFPKSIEFRSERNPHNFISLYEDRRDRIIFIGNKFGQACYSQENGGQAESPENIDLSSFPKRIDVQEIGKKLWLNLESGIFEMPAIR